MSDTTTPATAPPTPEVLASLRDTANEAKHGATPFDRIYAYDRFQKQATPTEVLALLDLIQAQADTIQAVREVLDGKDETVRGLRRMRFVGAEAKAQDIADTVADVRAALGGDAR